MVVILPLIFCCTHTAPYEKVSEAIAHFLNCLLGESEQRGGGGGGGREGRGRDHVEETTINGHTSSSSSKKKQRKKKSSKNLFVSGIYTQLPCCVHTQCRQ